ncbi:uncharacterized protein RAG0_10864 [Rhynchosporium agropyri]|uniref:2EXR domain-containing protein n=1 Tax=Rhynchosporium agropyri TaxID=914238 RepID=A0A1E1L1K7_9HELO|nr:uncharacterized protein RAG0_10864 [Rhynchosporium agropyri]
MEPFTPHEGLANDHCLVQQAHLHSAIGPTTPTSLPRRRGSLSVEQYHQIEQYHQMMAYNVSSRALVWGTLHQPQFQVRNHIESSDITATFNLYSPLVHEQLLAKYAEVELRDRQDLETFQAQGHIDKRPFATFTKGPMVNSSHQRLKIKLTQAKFQRLSRKKLAVMKAEKTSTFDPFPRLPIELRCMIYALMIPDRQVIEIKTRFPLPGGNREHEFAVSYDFPAICYISREARDWASWALNYKPAFGANLNGHELYYNPQRDSLLFHDLYVFEEFFNTGFGTGRVSRTKAIDPSRAIEAPLYLAINHAWEIMMTKRSFRLLGQPKNIVLARRSARAGFWDNSAKLGIEESLSRPVAFTESNMAKEKIVLPKLISLWTFKVLRDTIERLNRPPPVAVVAPGN